MKHHMQTNDPQPDVPRRANSGTLIAVSILLILAIIATGCAKSQSPVSKTISPAERDAALRQIAVDYCRTGDLSQTQAALDKLELANPAQLIVSLAESDASAGRPAEEIAPLAQLAEALGTRSSKLIAYLEPTPAPSPTIAPPTIVPTPVPPRPTPVPSLTPTLPPTATSLPPTATPTPQKPRVVADGDVNLRAGPSKVFPVIGRLAAGQEVDIVGRNDSGDWWQLVWSGQEQAWVAGTVVQVLGPIDTIAIAENIPTPPPTPTPAPTVVPQPTATPKPAGPDFQLIERRLWDVVENGGHLAGTSVNCGGGHMLRVTTLDAAGNRLNGVTIKVAGGGQQEIVTGSQGKGDGIAEFDLFEPGSDVYVFKDADGRQVTSDTAAAPTMTNAISFDILIGARFCTNAEDCNHFLSRGGCNGHYSWSATFRRAY